MNTTIRVALLFGGRSAEHDVSILSARNIAATLQKARYEVIPVCISREGNWLSPSFSQDVLQGKVSPTDATTNDQILPYSQEHLTADVMFPILHGTYGEDGTLQGLLRLLDVPFVGADVLGSAVGMDKDVMKRLLRDAKIPITPFLVSTRSKPVSFSLAAKKLGLPLFVKPANAGSSVGVAKVATKKAFDKAVSEALTFDRKVMLEKLVRGREIEVSVLGNERPRASLPGEIVPTHDFYSYEAKYLDENGAHTTIPARVPKSIIKELQATAIKAYEALTCEGMGRVDFFLTKSGKILVNEINTLPGFTNISMYPKLWEASGVNSEELIHELIRLALERHATQKTLKTKPVATDKKK